MTLKIPPSIKIFNPSTVLTGLEPFFLNSVDSTVTTEPLLGGFIELLS